MGSITPSHPKVLVPKSLTGDYTKSPCEPSRRVFMTSVNLTSRPEAGKSLLKKYWVSKSLQQLIQARCKKKKKNLSSCSSMVMKYPLPHWQESLKEIYLLLDFSQVPSLYCVSILQRCCSASLTSPDGWGCFPPRKWLHFTNEQSKSLCGVFIELFQAFWVESLCRMIH